MGADLYILKLDRSKQITGFRTDIDAGYFRDSYNHWNLLWKFGLSYWNDIPKLCKDDPEQGYVLTPKGAKKLLVMLKKREPQFFAKTKKMNDEDQLYFLNKYEELKKFLHTAIKIKSGIDCSV